MKEKFLICAGCKALCSTEFLGYYASQEYERLIYRCPCLTCLVKPVCTDICLEFARFEFKRYTASFSKAKCSFGTKGHMSTRKTTYNDTVRVACYRLDREDII